MDDFSLSDDTRLLHSPSTSINTILPSNALWSFRLEHGSNKSIIHMTLLYTSILFDNKATCDICHLARQKKLSFYNSFSTTSSKFEVLNLDKWIPIAIPSMYNHK